MKYFYIFFSVFCLISCSSYKNTNKKVYNDSDNLNHYTQIDSINASIIDVFGYSPNMFLLKSASLN